jgi:hypothetical protein
MDQARIPMLNIAASVEQFSQQNRLWKYTHFDVTSPLPKGFWINRADERYQWHEGLG